MKLFFVITTLLLSLNAFANINDLLANSASPYETLKKAYNEAPRAATLDDMDWPTNFSKNWSDCIVYNTDGKINQKIVVVKWKKVDPANGPLFPGSNQILTSVLTVGSANDIGDYGDTNIISDKIVIIISSSSSENALVANNITMSTVQFFKSDNSNIFFKILYANPAGGDNYGYCWKK